MDAEDQYCERVIRKMERSNKKTEENRLLYLYTFGSGMAVMSLGVLLIAMLYGMDHLWRKYQILLLSVNTINRLELYAAIFALTGVVVITTATIVDTIVYLVDKKNLKNSRRTL